MPIWYPRFHVVTMRPYNHFVSVLENQSHRSGKVPLNVAGREQNAYINLLDPVTLLAVLFPHGPYGGIMIRRFPPPRFSDGGAITPLFTLIVGDRGNMFFAPSPFYLFLTLTDCVATQGLSEYPFGARNHHFRPVPNDVFNYHDVVYKYPHRESHVASPPCCILSVPGYHFLYIIPMQGGIPPWGPFQPKGNAT